MSRSEEIKTGSQYKNQWVMLALVVFIVTSSAAALFKVPPIMNILMEDMQLTASQTGLIYSSFALVGIFLALPIGMIINKFGIWVSGAIALVSLLAGSIIAAFSTTLTPLLLSRIVEGIGLTFMSTMGPSVVSSIVEPDKRGKAMGVYITFMSLGQVLMFNVSPRLATSFGWQGVMWFTAIYSVACLAIWILFFRFLNNPAQISNSTSEEKASLGTLLKSADVWKVAIVITFFMVSLQGVLGFIPTYLVQVRGMDASSASSLTSLVGAVGIPSAIIGGWCLDKFGSRKKVVSIFLILSGIVYIAFPYVPTAIIAVVIAMVGCFPNAAPAGIYAAGTEIFSNPGLASLSMAVVILGQNLGLFLSAPVFGYIVDNINWNLAFLVMGIVSAIGGFVMLTMKKVK